MADGKTGMESCISAQPRYGFGMGVYFLGDTAVTAVNSQAGAGVNGMRGATRGSRCFMLFAASSFGAAFRSLAVISGRIRARTVHFLGNRSLRLQNLCFLSLPYEGQEFTFRRNSMRTSNLVSRFSDKIRKGIRFFRHGIKILVSHFLYLLMLIVEPPWILRKALLPLQFVTLPGLQEAPYYAAQKIGFLFLIFACSFWEKFRAVSRRSCCWSSRPNWVVFPGIRDLGSMIEAPHGDPQQQLQLQLSAMVPAAGQNCCTIQGINASTLSLSIEQYAVKFHVNRCWCMYITASFHSRFNFTEQVLS